MSQTQILHRQTDGTQKSCLFKPYMFADILTNICTFCIYKSYRRYKSPTFAKDLLDIILAMRLPTWSATSASLKPEQLRVSKVAGSLTNAVFFVSYPSIPSLKTLLLRIYGPSSSNLISRPRELHTLHVLSSRYGIGPRVYGTFENGRVEEYFDSLALTAAQLRDPTISSWIGARMSELHCVDIETVENTTPDTRGENVGWEIAARKNFREWSQSARDVLHLPSVNADYKSALDFERFIEEWERYMVWLKEWEMAHGASKRVFAHNDTQYGNLLRLKGVKKGTPDHRQVRSVISFPTPFQSTSILTRSSPS